MGSDMSGRWTDSEVYSSALFGNDPIRDLSNNMFRNYGSTAELGHVRGGLWRGRSRLILRFAAQPYSEMTLLEIFLTTCFGLQLSVVRKINVVSF